MAKKEFKAAPARAEQKEKKKEKEGKRTIGKKEQQVTSGHPSLGLNSPLSLTCRWNTTWCTGPPQLWCPPPPPPQSAL